MRRIRPWGMIGILVLSSYGSPGCKRRERTASDRDGETELTSSPPQSPPTREQLADLRAEVLAEVPPFAGRPEYAITDPAFVDPFLHAALDRIEGRMPRDGSERAEVIRRAGVALRNQLREPAGLAALGAVIERRYHDPVIERIGDVVHIDAGVVAGTYRVSRGSIVVGESSYLDRNEWSSAEIVRHLQLGMAKHPDARTYQAEIEIPARWAEAAWTYVYDRGSDRIRLYSAKWSHYVYFTPPLGGSFAAYLEGNASLHHFDLEWEEPGAWTGPARLHEIRAKDG